VHVVRGDLPAEGYYRMEDGAWWDHTYREIKRKFPEPRTKKLAIPAYTRFDPETKRVRGHTALGGGSLALFGGGSLFSWPSGLKDVFRAFGDARPVDGTRVHDDSAGRGTFWGLASTTMGAALHELGHTFGLPHSSDEFDIMSRGFDRFNRAFTFVEPPASDRSEAKVFLPGRVAYWAPHSATALRASRWFALDDRDWKDSGGPRISLSTSPPGIRVEAANGLRFLGIDADGEAIDHREFWRAGPQRVLVVPRAEILKGDPGKAYFRAVDDQGIEAGESWADLAPHRKY
jgi:hypothetical protein